MGLIDRWMETRPLVKGIIISSILAVLAAAGIIIYLVSGSYYAKTMKLLDFDGTVTIEDTAGSSKTIVGNMRFESGYTLNTGAKSTASVEIDSDKKVTLQENSRVTFTKNSKKTDIDMADGGLFFEVNKPLASDETFSIKASAISVSIRGTSGYVYTDGNGRPCLVVTAGHVKLTAVNPVTNEMKEIEVGAGKKVTVIMYDDRTVDSVEFIVENITEDRVPEFALKVISDDPYVLARVCQETGWDANLLCTLAGGTVSLPTESSESSESGTSESSATSEASETSAAATATASASASASATPSAEASESAAATSKAPTATPTPKPTPKPTKRPTVAPTSSAATSSPAEDTDPAEKTKDPSDPTEMPAPVTEDPGPEPEDPIIVPG
ncbi:FecR family protein [Ruminococcaceae bacterium YRB3002]|nr:FecR family protein [Ruminococcaceae bacterium YRB3002]